jgi:hypothetical protein
MSRFPRPSALRAGAVASLTKRFALRILAVGALPVAFGAGCATSAPPVNGPANAVDPTLSVGPPPYQSAYADYQPYREQRIAGWKEVHREVSSVSSGGGGHAGHGANGARKKEANEEAPPTEKGPHDAHGTPSSNR